MPGEPIVLKGVQLAYARAIAAIELKFYAHSHSSSRDDDDAAYEDAQSVVRQLERDGGLSPMSMWRQHVPLIDLYDFSKIERDLLLDLADAGGVQITRRPADRYRSLGCGSSGKAAVMLSSQHDRWTLKLTKRGEALVEAIRAEAKGGSIDA